MIISETFAAAQAAWRCSPRCDALLGQQGVAERCLSRSLNRLRRLLEELADPDGPNPETAASSAASATSSSAASATSPPAAASSAAASSAAASMAAPSASGSKPYAACSGIFLIEDIEGRQADVRYFLLSEDHRCGVLRRLSLAELIEADAPPASDKAPATPNAVTTLPRPLPFEVCFERDIVATSLWLISPELGPKAVWRLCPAPRIKRYLCFKVPAASRYWPQCVGLRPASSS